jgi:hypothetical protein
LRVARRFRCSTGIIFSNSQVSLIRTKRTRAGLPEVDRSPSESRHGPLDPQALVPALRLVLAPLQGMLGREIADRRTLQHQADDLRDQLAAATPFVVDLSGQPLQARLEHVPKR